MMESKCMRRLRVRRKLKCQWLHWGQRTIGGEVLEGLSSKGGCGIRGWDTGN